ncbi:MAG: hypothetical protein PHZ07_04070 [Patescibacteria group bacterium]|nr:hypothetical protein [Patescibacteria group bacterium]MDD4304488.1 hypothetical protein [Patescibacteria group bacterium]MDD4694848.1 hypothetical protein [Patescibacteria group bacterium]
MNTTTDIILLIILFIILGISADFAVKNIKNISKKLGIKIFTLGIILGIMTSFPEMILGINASIKNISNISAGNLFGGIMVLFGLILGTSLILNKKIKTNGKSFELLPQISFIFFPILLGLDGKFSIIDGIFIIISYVLLLFYLYKRNKKDEQGIQISFIKEQKITKYIFIIIISIIILLFTSDIIIRISTDLLNKTNINPFVIGLIMFSIGTNLPEIIITLTSWRKKNSELSFSHIMGSAMANIMILGLISIIKPINIIVDNSYIMLIPFIALILSLIVLFYKTGKILSRIEGIFLISLYVLFVYLNIFINKLW